VRRVLAGLKERGLITQTVGSGTYVSAHIAESLAAMADGGPSRSASPAELMSARLALEPAIIEMVIGNANSAWDSLLHEVIADSAHNSFISGVFRMMNQARSDAEWGMLKRRSATPERRLDYQREHRALVDALQQRDAQRARELCVAHLVHVRVNMLGS
jgi:DNA-binding FadR family transcriptional regulator